MLERAPEYAVMLCFDVKVDREAEDMAQEMGVKIFAANIIYHLFDSFTAYQKVHFHTGLTSGTFRIETERGSGKCCLSLCVVDNTNFPHARPHRARC
jgi:hypothetical protein